MRLFYAVKASEEVKSEISNAIARFPVRNPPWRWIATDNLHVTLKFLGEVEDRLLDDFIEAGSSVAACARPFKLAYGPFGAFPNLSRPRVIFFEAIEGAKELASLASLLEAEALRLGIPKEDRPFRAHLTLARIKTPLGASLARELSQVPALSQAASQTVDRFSLMQSHLARSGATYEEIRSFELG